MSRFKVTRFGNPKKVTTTNKPSVIAAMKKVLATEEKTISKVKKKAKKENIELSEIHHKLLLFAIREHCRAILKPFSDRVNKMSIK